MDSIFKRNEEKLIALGCCCVYFALSPIGNFNTILLASRGYSVKESGVVLASWTLAILLVSPVVSFIADRYKQHLNIFITSCALSCIFLVGFCFLSSKLLAALAFSLIGVVMSFILPLNDHLIMHILGRDGEHRYGVFRGFGAFGFALGAIASSLILPRLDSNGVHKPLSPVVKLWLILGFSMAMSLSSWAAYQATKQNELSHLSFPEGLPEEEGKSQEPEEETPLGLLDSLVFVKNMGIELIVWSAMMCLVGAVVNFITTFGTLFQHHELRVSETLLATRITFGMAIEMTWFTLTPRLLSREWKPDILFTASLIPLELWVAGFACMFSAYLVIPVEVFRATGFAVGWVACITFLSSKFPVELRSSALSFVYAAYNGVGGTASMLVGSFLYDTFGSRESFAFTAVIVLISSIAFALWIRRHRFEEQIVDNNPVEDMEVKQTTHESLPSDITG